MIWKFIINFFPFPLYFLRKIEKKNLLDKRARRTLKQLVFWAFPFEGLLENKT